MQAAGVLFHNAVWGCIVGTGRSTNTDVNWSVICFWMRVVSSIVGRLINHSIHYEVATLRPAHTIWLSTLPRNVSHIRFSWSSVYFSQALPCSLLSLYYKKKIIRQIWLWLHMSTRPSPVSCCFGCVHTILLDFILFWFVIIQVSLSRGQLCLVWNLIAFISFWRPSFPWHIQLQFPLPS